MGVERSLANRAKQPSTTSTLEPGAPGPKRLRARALSPAAPQRRRAAAFPIVGVGASSGGLDAFSQLLAALPADTGMAFVLVQRLDRTHPSLLASALSSTTSMPVVEAADGERLEPNRVYVTPPDADVRVVDDTLALAPRRRGERKPELPIDYFLRSLAEAHGSHAIGVVLSGSGSDGTEGLKAVRCEGGLTLTQEPSEAAFDGMPRSAIEAGVTDRILPVAALARELERLSRHPYLAAARARREPCDDASLGEVYAALRSAVGVDFSEYKRASFERRLARRMALRKVATVSEYLRVLRDDPLELGHLHDDALLLVTSFFRDPEVFEHLKARIIPELLVGKPSGEPIRVWVAGCSTGEELYSIAITLLEVLGEAANIHPIQIFGSDLSEKAIEQARFGVYGEQRTRGLSPERRSQFFTKYDSGLRINKSVRDLCVFLHHDLASDPPLTKIDLLSCRNVLSYFGAPLQRRVLQRFHQALRPRGRLLLGRHESASRHGSLFTRLEVGSSFHERAALAGAQGERLTGELRSLSEQLAVAREELLSVNEELIAVNDELQNRNHEAAEVNSDLSNLLSAFDLPILILDAQRRIRRFNPAARGVLNLLQSDVGRPIAGMRFNLRVDDLDQRVAHVIGTDSMHDSEVQDRGGTWYRMQIRPYKSVDARIDGATISLVDIDVLKRHLSEAEQATEAAERANRAKDEFLMVLSHELRTPLSTMLMQAQRLSRGDPAPADVKRAGEAIERGTRMQVQLIDDLLDVSRIVTGKLPIERRTVHLASVIKAALEGVSAMIERKRLKLLLRLDARVGPVTGDPTRLQQVVANLLANAIKFSTEEGELCAALDTVEGRARIRISDTGIGIDPAFMPHLFTRFSQEDGTTVRRHGGLGLGLAIARHIVEAHGGTITAESAGKGKGATFSVLLPLAPQKAANPTRPDGNGATAAQPAPSPRKPLDALRVLCVDDDPGILEAVSQTLRDTGAAVREASSAYEALEVAREFRPELLVCDIAMPDEDGYSLLQKLRAMDAARGAAPVQALALTALAGPHHRAESLAAGFQMHLTKPIDVDQLTRALVELANRGDEATH